MICSKPLNYCCKYLPFENKWIRPVLLHLEAAHFNEKTSSKTTPRTVVSHSASQRLNGVDRGMLDQLEIMLQKCLRRCVPYFLLTHIFDFWLCLTNSLISNPRLPSQFLHIPLFLPFISSVAWRRREKFATKGAGSYYSFWFFIGSPVSSMHI